MPSPSRISERNYLVPTSRDAGTAHSNSAALHPTNILSESVDLFKVFRISHFARTG
jgi:hypothetical protein